MVTLEAVTGHQEAEGVNSTRASDVQLYIEYSVKLTNMLVNRDPTQLSKSARWSNTKVTSTNASVINTQSRALVNMGHAVAVMLHSFMAGFRAICDSRCHSLWLTELPVSDSQLLIMLPHYIALSCDLSNSTATALHRWEHSVSWLNCLVSLLNACGSAAWLV